MMHIVDLSSLFDSALRRIALSRQRTAAAGATRTDASFTLAGGNLADAKEVVFYEPGLSVTKLQVVNANQVKATLKIASDCRLGEHATAIADGHRHHRIAHASG